MGQLGMQTISWVETWLDHPAQIIIVISRIESNLAAGDHWHSPGTNNGTNTGTNTVCFY